MANLLPNLIQKFINDNGTPLVGGKLYSYAAGTTTPLATYTDETEGSFNTNPIILDANGSAQVWIGAASYKFVLKDPLDVVLKTVDNVAWINNGTITTAKIADDAVTKEKIDAGIAGVGLHQDGDGSLAVGVDGVTIELNSDSLRVKKSSLDETYLNPATDLHILNKTIEVAFSRGPGSPGACKIQATFQYPFTLPTALTAPGVLPGSAGRGVTWTPDGLGLLVASDSGVNGYERVGATLTSRNAGISGTTASVKSVTHSPDGSMIAWGYNSGGVGSVQILSIYSGWGFSSAVGSTPATDPLIGVNCVAWSPSSEFLAAALVTTPFVAIYQRSQSPSITNAVSFSGVTPNNPPVKIAAAVTNTTAAINAVVDVVNSNIDQIIQTVLTNNTSNTTFTKLSNPSNLPAGQGNGCAWSHDGQFLAVFHSVTPFVTIYQRAGTTFTKLSDPASLPASTAYGGKFSPDGNYLVVAHDTTPFVTIYSISGTTFTKIANPATLPAGIGRAAAWSTNSSYLAVAHDTTPFVTIYAVSGSTFTKITNPVTLPAGNGNGVAFSTDNKYLAVAHTTTPFMTVYQTASTLSANGMLYLKAVPSV